MTKKKDTKLLKGSTELLTVKLTSGEIHVQVRLLEHRMVFGRSEWKVAPVAGNGSTWIQERSFSDGVAWSSPSEQTATRKQNSYGPDATQVIVDDAEQVRSFASRRPRS